MTFPEIFRFIGRFYISLLGGIAWMVMRSTSGSLTMLEMVIMSIVVALAATNFGKMN